jgi:predicted DNA-binding transcriptional regulator YafY
VKLDLMINRELEREIMSYGDHLKVVSPKHFQERMKELYRTIEEVYDEE